MIYDMYYCEECDLLLENERSIKDDPIKLTCPGCDAGLSHKMPHTFNFSVQQDPQTFGHLADRNTRQMGQYEIQERRHADSQRLAESRKKGREELEKRLPPGASIVDRSKQKATPWWRPGTTGPDMSLAKLSGEKLEKFVMTGDKT